MSFSRKYILSTQLIGKQEEKTKNDIFHKIKFLESRLINEWLSYHPFDKKLTLQVQIIVKDEYFPKLA